MTGWIDKMAPNLKDVPYGESAVKFIETAANLGNEPVHDFLRCPFR